MAGGRGNARRAAARHDASVTPRDHRAHLEHLYLRNTMRVREQKLRAERLCLINRKRFEGGYHAKGIPIHSCRFVDCRIDSPDSYSSGAPYPQIGSGTHIREPAVPQRSRLPPLALGRAAGHAQLQ